MPSVTAGRWVPGLVNHPAVSTRQRVASRARHLDVNADEAWERLRASRWKPPGRANGGSRRKTYAAALEQTEQMFRAAAIVGPATRPLQVFYGLSQAGRIAVPFSSLATPVTSRFKRSGQVTRCTQVQLRGPPLRSLLRSSPSLPSGRVPSRP
ncbi:YaaC family protein [Streptomyces sp. NPDC087300]|uniref:YaaC family protein n=1 Tax=Streptomyces sp. NPDC087300 TaxID=3365780 RepID=UPI0037F41FA8